MEVINDIKGSRFLLNVDGEEVYVMYAEDKSDIELYSTYTPPILRGKGLAAIVVKAGFDYAKEKNLKVIAGCWYVRKFAEMFKEYGELLK
jgi:uncharacterized protein